MISVRFKPNCGTHFWSVERRRYRWASVRSAKVICLKRLQIIIIIIIVNIIVVIIIIIFMEK